MLEYPEKRDYQRIEIECPARFRVDGGDSTAGAVVKNLSGGGVLLWIEQEVEPGRQLSIEIIPAHPITPPLSARVEVVRCYPVEEGNFAVACRIEQIIEPPAPEPD